MMRLYVLIEEYDPYDYHDYHRCDDHYGIVIAIFDDYNKLAEFVNHKRKMSYQKCINEGREISGGNNGLSFSWFSSFTSYYVVDIDTNTEVYMRPEDWIEQRANQAYNVDYLTDFFNRLSLSLWRPNEDDIIIHNAKLKDKSSKNQEKIKQFQKMREELRKEGLLK